MFSKPFLSHLDHSSLVGLNSVLDTFEPTSFTQAKEDPRWVEATKKEINAFEAN